MTKTEILKFCGNDIYPIHNGMKRGIEEVKYYIESNRRVANINPILFYSRQRGINCIPMYIYKKFLSVDLVGIEKGIVSHKDIHYYNLGSISEQNRNVKLFVYGEPTERTSEELLCSWGNSIARGITASLRKSCNKQILVIDGFYYKKLSIENDYDNIQCYRKNSQDYECLVIVAMSIPLTINGITIDSSTHIELRDQSSERVDSYMSYGGISQLEMQRNFDIYYQRRRIAEPSKLFYYYDMLRRRYDEEGF